METIGVGKPIDVMQHIGERWGYEAVVWRADKFREGSSAAQWRSANDGVTFSLSADVVELLYVTHIDYYYTNFNSYILTDILLHIITQQQAVNLVNSDRYLRAQRDRALSTSRHRFTLNFE